MNNLQLAVSCKQTNDEDLFSGVNGTNEVTMGDPSINLMPKFMSQGETAEGRVLINDEDEIMM